MANETSGISGVGAEFWRAKRQDCDGSALTDADDLCDVAGYVTCKFTEITRTPVLIEGETITQNTAAGRPCVNIEREDTVTGYDYTLSQCDVDSEAKEILGVVSRILVDAEGDTIGHEFSGGSQACSCSDTATACRDIFLEFWRPVYRCSEQVGVIRHVVPRIKFTEGTNTVNYGNAVALEQFEGRSKPNSNFPPTGPWGDIPASVAPTGDAPFEFFEATIPTAVSDAAGLGTYIPCDYTGESPS